VSLSLLEKPQMRGEIACLSDARFSQSTRSVVTLCNDLVHAGLAGHARAACRHVWGLIHRLFSSEAADVEFSIACL
jgi:hypothetical protein